MRSKCSNTHSLAMSQKQQGILDPEIKVYNRRWLVLGIYILLAAVSTFQWIQYSIITNIVMRFYNVNSMAVDWTSVIYKAVYTPLVIPASYLIEKKGVRIAVLISGVGTAIGTVLKIFSVKTGFFWLVLICQAILAANQTLLSGLPPKLAAVWFGPDQVSTACALGVFGSQLGIALGFIVPPILVKNHDNVEQIGKDLYFLTCLLAGIITAVAAIIIIYFPDKPPLPPSPNQLEARKRLNSSKSEGYIAFLKTLLSNKPFLMHVTAFGMNAAVYTAFVTLLGQITARYFPNDDELAGQLGLILVIMGMCGSISNGFILDKTKKYKQSCFIVYFLTFVLFAVFMCILEYRSRTMVYTVIVILGYFLDAYLSASLEFTVELTYPATESTTASIMFSMGSIFSCVMATETGWVFSRFGPFWAIFNMASLLLVGSILTVFIPNQLRRQAAIKEPNIKMNMDYISIKNVEAVL